MKRVWQRLAARISALSLRERFLLFASIMVVLGFVTHQLFIAPLNRLQVQRARELERLSASSEAQIERIEQQLARSRRSRKAQLESQIASTQAQIAEVDGEIGAVTRASSDEAALRAVLTRTFARGERGKVMLVRVSTAQPPAVPSPASPSASASVIEIVLSGGYLDLMEALSALEKALPQARWSAMRLSAETVTAQVSVRMVASGAAP